MSRRLHHPIVGSVVTLAVLLLPSHATADPATFSAPPPSPVHLHTASDLATDGGSKLRLPPGYYLDEPTWSTLDVELHRLQTAETRLTAENASFRKSAAGWQPGWKTIATSLLVGVAGGVYLSRKL